MTTIYLVRHGEVHNPEEVYYGRIPGYRLSDTGESQARAAACALKGLSVRAVFASPQQRAQETARIIAAEQQGLTVETLEALNEAHTPYDGSSYVDMSARKWDLYTGTDADFEQPAQIMARVRGFYDEVLRRYRGETVVAVTHGDVVAFSILWAKGLPLLPAIRSSMTQAGLPEDYPAPASLTALTFAESDLPEVRYLRPY